MADYGPISKVDTFYAQSTLGENMRRPIRLVTSVITVAGIIGLTFAGALPATAVTSDSMVADSSQIVTTAAASGITTSFTCRKGTSAAGCSFSDKTLKAGTDTIGFSGNSSRQYFDVAVEFSRGVCGTGGSTAASYKIACTDQPKGAYTLYIKAKEKFKQDVNFYITEPS